MQIVFVETVVESISYRNKKMKLKSQVIKGQVIMSSTMSSEQLIISNRLISAVSAGHLETARELINSFGLSYSKAWSDGYALLLDATFMNRTAVVELLLKSGSPCNSNHYKPADTPLHFAALHANIHVIKMLLNKGANINAKNQYGKTPLFNMIDIIDYDYKQDKLEVIQLLLKHKADVNVSDNDGTSPLHIAVKKRCLKIVELLLDYGVNVNCVMYAAKWNKNYAPLHYAVQYNLKGVITLLLSRSADVNVKAENNITPLHIAAERGYTHIAEELLNHGACINSLTLEEGFTPLHIASEQGYDEMVKLLLNRGADVNASTKNTLTPLHVAMKRRNIAILNLLLEHGAKVDYKDKDDKIILQHAVEDGCLMIVENILKYSPDIHDQCNRNSLKVAVHGDKKEIVQTLLEYGFNVNREDTNDAELLHAAVKKGYLKIVEDLLKHGADVNILYNKTYEDGYTPLHTAAIYEQEEMAKLLISYEADINAQDESGKTPIFYAIKNADIKMTKLLLINNTSVKDDPELLIFAVEKGCIEIVEALLQYGADINYSDKYGRTALHFTTLMKNSGFTAEQSNINTIFLQKMLGKSKNSFTIERSLQYDVDDTFRITALEIASDRSSTNSSSSFDSPNHQDPDINGEIAELLLSKGANVNAQTKDGETSLHAAIKNGYAKVVEVLLKYNANLNSTVKTDDLPLHLSAQIGNEEIIRMILNKGADVNAKQTNGMTALHIAVAENNTEVVEILLDSGADINSRDDYGRTALHIASKCAHVRLVIILLTNGSDINVVCKNNQTPLDYASHKLHELLTFDSEYGPFSAAKILTRFVVKMKAANLYVSEQNLLSIRTNELIKDYQDKCEKEIQNMKNEKINNANIFFYDILARDTNILAKCMRNQNIVQVLQSDDYGSKFPLYASMLKNHFKKAMVRKELLKQGNEIFYFLFNDVPEIPDDCTEKILTYLSDKDLKSLMNAVNGHLS